jgi:hypothetical protein
VTRTCRRRFGARTASAGTPTFAGAACVARLSISGDFEREVAVVDPWWRIEVDADGKVVACVQVAESGDASHDVFYVQAATRSEAGRRAWNAYCKVNQTRRRAKLAAEGKCPWCGEKNDRPKGRRCRACLLRDSKYERDRRARARARGEDVPAPDRSVAIAARANEERRRIRLTILREVRTAWRDAESTLAFIQWLRDELEQLGEPAQAEAAE